ncbi:hypothetical protein ACHAXR_011886 [Thalassiosira sp. AJA248-18]
MIRPLATLATRPIQSATKLFLRSVSVSAANANANATPFFDNASHGGIPIGAVQLISGMTAPFHDLINRTLRNSVRNKKHLTFRGVQPFVGPRNQLTTIPMEGQERSKGGSDSGRLLLIHLPPAVATALDDGHPELVDFLKQNDGVYMPGLRRSTKHREATRKRRNARDAHTSTYLQPRPNADSSCDTSLIKPPENPTFSFSELFAGIGGFRLGLEAIGGKCVFANEIDPCAASIYRHNFATSDCLIEADILDIHAEADIPADTDILTAGFPCQPFSSRGKQRGFSDERGQLYRELVRVLKSSHPKSFIFENVAGLVTMGTGAGGRFPGRGNRNDAGPVFQLILRAFEDCGYNVTWNICNSRHYVAQQRERVFIVGVRKDLVRKHKYSWDWYDQMLQGGSDAYGISKVVRDIMEPPDSLAVTENELTPDQWAKLQEIHTKWYGGIDNAYINIDAKAPTLISSYRRSGSYSSRFIFNERDRTKREIPRYLTPRECCRLMGFPEDYNVPSIGRDGIVATAHFYSGIGNAVVPPVVASIGKELVDYLHS